MATNAVYFLVGILLSIALLVNGKCVLNKTTTTTDCRQESSTSCSVGDLACYAQRIYSGKGSGAPCSPQEETTPVEVEGCFSETRQSKMTIFKKPYTVNVASASRNSTGGPARVPSSFCDLQSTDGCFYRNNGSIVNMFQLFEMFVDSNLLLEGRESVYLQPLAMLNQPIGRQNMQGPYGRPPTLAKYSSSTSSATDRPRLSASFQSYSGLNAYEEKYVANNGNEMNLEPPEARLCVGNGFVLQTTHGALRVFSAAKFGEALTPPLALNTFYSLPPMFDESTSPPTIGTMLLSPSCHYDADTNRWFHTVIQREMFSAKSWILLAVSTSSDPTQDWIVYSIPAQNDGSDGTPHDHGCKYFSVDDAGYVDGPCMPEDVRLGVNKHGVYITTNEYSLRPVTVGGMPGFPSNNVLWVASRFLQPNIYALPKENAVKGLAQISLVNMVGNKRGFSLAPAVVVPGAADGPQPPPGSTPQEHKRMDPLGFGGFVSKLLPQDLSRKAGDLFGVSTAGKGPASGPGGPRQQKSDTPASGASKSSGEPSTDDTVMFLSVLPGPMSINRVIRLSEVPNDTVYLWKLLNTASLSTPNPSLDFQMYTLYVDDEYRSPTYAEQPTYGTSSYPIGECLVNADCASRLGTFSDPSMGPRGLYTGFQSSTRVNNVVQIGSKVWGVWSTEVKESGTGVTGAYWVEVDGNGGSLSIPTLTNHGIVSLGRNSILAPSIGMTAANKGVISFTVSGEDYYPTAAFVPFDGSTTGELVVVKQGTAYHDSYFCYDAFGLGAYACPWSLSSSSQTDSGGNIWTATQLIETDGTTCTLDHWMATDMNCNKTRTMFTNWATRISKISIA